MCVVFLFKQKTAYELRISDWSSDVCSSDLESLRDVVKKLMPTVQSVSLGVEVEASRDIFSKGVSIKIDDGVLTDVLDKGHGMQRSLVFSLQIGRASCRERVCQYVSIPVVAVYLKKKHDTKQQDKNQA